MNSNPYKAIQFIGTQRSGSNLLRLMLNQLPEISAPHPPNILKTFYPILKEYRDLNVSSNFLVLAHDVCEWVNLNPVPWEGVTFNAEDIVKQCREKSLLELFVKIHELKAKHDNANYWCCKSMESVKYIKQIEDAGINPFYIYIFRDGRDAALSFLKAIVGPKHVYFLAKKWKEEQHLAIEAKKLIGPSRFISVRYEELIHDPRKVLKEICAVLGVTFSDEVFEYYHSHESVNTAVSGQMWKNVVKPIMPDNHDKFKREFTNDQLVIFERVAGEVLHALGYETIFWPNVSQEPFTGSELESFQHAAGEEYLKVIHNAGSDELERRKPQEDLLQRILNRSAVIK